MRVGHDDRMKQEIGPGHAYVIEPGHDAWVVGDEPVVGFDFESRMAEEFGKVLVAPATVLVAVVAAFREFWNSSGGLTVDPVLALSPHRAGGGYRPPPG